MTLLQTEGDYEVHGEISLNSVLNVEEPRFFLKLNGTVIEGTFPTKAKAVAASAAMTKVKRVRSALNAAIAAEAAKVAEERDSLDVSAGRRGLGKF